MRRIAYIDYQNNFLLFTFYFLLPGYNKFNMLRNRKEIVLHYGYTLKHGSLTTWWGINKKDIANAHLKRGGPYMLLVNIYKLNRNRIIP